MAINQNHLFEELNGVKCAVVEKNVGLGRVGFLRGILEYNGFTVVVVGTPPPKAAGVAAGGSGSGATGATGAGSGVAGAGVTAGGAAGVEAGSGLATPAPAPETFTIGVTDVTFNSVNAIFGRLLKAPGGHIVTLAYWKQQENVPDDEKPYFERR